MGMTFQNLDAHELDTGALAAILRLHRTFRGALHLPGEAGYEAQRHVVNPALDPRPAIIAEASDAVDVQTALFAAREHELAFSVQATGHGTHVPNDGGLVVKTGAMAGVVVDPQRRVARVGAGARWGQVLRAAAPFGLAPLAGSSPDVGVVGYTLGGGIGWLARKHGFAADSVIGADVVTAEGRLLSVSANRHPELFWALRGGGPGFGVVTALEFRLHPVAEVYAGVEHYEIEHAREILDAYRTLTASAPDELSTALLLTRLDDGRRVVALKAMHAGPADEAERLLAPLRAAAGPAVGGGFATQPFADATMGGTPPRHLDLVAALPDALLDVLVQTAEDRAVNTVELRHWGGAMSTAGPDAGPVSHRGAQFSVIVDAQVPAVAEALRPHAIGGSFLNFLGDTTRTAEAFTRADHFRLREVKRTYDPCNVLGAGHAIEPAAPRGARLGTSGPT